MAGTDAISRRGVRGVYNPPEWTLEQTAFDKPPTLSHPLPKEDESVSKIRRLFP